MSPWIAKAVFLAASVALIAIRAPHGHRSRTVKVARRFAGTLETILLAFAWIGYFFPLIWVASSLLAIADYPLLPIPFAAGIACYVLGLWLFCRTHADLGTNWSITLELREGHRLVTHGVYRRVRHPMYSALLLYSLGQALVVPNWMAGPSYLVIMVVLIGCRLRVEERMMREQFGDEYAAYMARTKRLIPGLW